MLVDDIGDWGTMSITSSQWRAAIFATVATLTVVNALAPCGGAAARWGAVILQAVVGAGALLAAAVAAGRGGGASRWWRLLVVAATTSWLVGELSWWSSGATSEAHSAPAFGVVAYFLPPLLSLGAMVLLARAGDGLRGRKGEPSRLGGVVAVLDGLIAAVAFSMLVFFGGLDTSSGAALPRSQNTTVAAAYSLLELVVVVVAVLMAMVYRRDRPYRANFLYLSGGVALIATSDRMVGYLRTVGFGEGNLWGGVGAILGPLLIGFAVLELHTRPRGSRREEIMNWVQSALPYIGFLGIVVVCAFHVLIGQRLSTIVVLAGVTMVLLVTSRQLVAMRAQRLLTRRLYDVQYRLVHQAHHDPLTGLPNRLLFGQRLDDAVRDGEFILLFVDIDDFKDVNDQFGHAAGDELLCAVATRLRRCVDDSDTLARIGGDEFAILIVGECDAPEVVADRLRVALRDPFPVHGSSVRVRASMGLVHAGSGETTATSDDLMRQADSSMYAGKRLGKDTAVIYHPSSDVVVDFPSALRQANGAVPPGFSMVYQPVVTLPHGTPVAVEALSRWTAPNGMHIPPATFVSVAEGAGLGAMLDGMVLDLVCREVRESALELDVYVNIGAARLGNRAFEQQVIRTLDRHSIEADRLVLEITETVPIVDLAAGAAAIGRLRAMGVRVALDDFGAGYNSLTYLHELPVRIVKLDRGLTVGADADRSVALYRSLTALCDAMGLDVIAEGIERQAQADTVYAAGCLLAQGHLFGRAMPIGEMAGMGVASGVGDAGELLRHRPQT